MINKRKRKTKDINIFEEKILPIFFFKIDIDGRNNPNNIYFIWFLKNPFPEGNGSGPNSTALQCRDDPWRRSE